MTELIVRVPPNVAPIVKRSFGNYCRKHSIDIDWLSEKTRGLWLFKTTELRFKLTGDRAAVRQAERQFKQALMGF